MDVSSQETPSIPRSSNSESSIIKYRRILPLIISFGLTALIGYIFCRDVPDWRKSFKLMIQGNLLLILAGTFFEFLHMFFRAARWGSLLSTVKPNIRFKNLFSLTLIKYVINVIPPRSGEFAASILLARKENISSSTVIAASVFERILDLFSVFMIFTIYLVAWGSGAVGNTEGGAAIILSIRSYSIKGLLVFVIGLVILLLLLRNAHWAARVPSKIRIPMMGFLEGFRALQSHGAMFRVILLSIAVWLCITLQTWFLVRSYITAFPLIGATLIVVMTAAGVAIPTPAGFGGYQYFMSLALINFFGRLLSPIDPHSQVAGISNACYLVSVIPIFIAGLFLLNREGLSFGRIAGLRNLSNSELK
jgi:glycosyltransferase 2 family protein